MQGKLSENVSQNVHNYDPELDWIAHRAFSHQSIHLLVCPLASSGSPKSEEPPTFGAHAHTLSLYPPFTPPHGPTRSPFGHVAPANYIFRSLVFASGPPSPNAALSSSVLHGSQTHGSNARTQAYAYAVYSHAKSASSCACVCVHFV